MVRGTHIQEAVRDMLSIFQKFGGIRPMAAKLSVPPSTIKSWHAKRAIPDWRHRAVMEAALAHNVDLSPDEIVNIRPDSTEAPTQAAA